MTIDLVREFSDTISSLARSEKYGRGYLLTVPWTIGYAEAVSIYVEQLDDDLYLLTDRGMAADSLGDFDINLGKPGAWRSWEATVRYGHLAPALFAETSKYEIATTVGREDLGAALTSMGETILRTDGLRVLGKKRATTFRERSMKRAAHAGLAVVDRPMIRTRFAERRVSFGVDRSGEVASFFQTISGSDGLEGIDHARVVFGDANEINRNMKIALISSSARTQQWHIDALQEHATVVDESHQDAFFESLVA